MPDSNWRVEPGVYEFTDSEYRKIPYPSPSEMGLWVEGKEASGRHLLIGSAVHDALLSPDVARKRYRRGETEYDLRTKKGKAGLEAEEAEHSRLVLRPSEFNVVANCISAIKKSELWAKIQAALQDTEQTVVADLEDAAGNRVRCKGKLDLVLRKSIVDLKTVGWFKNEEFVNSLYTYRAHVQGAMYPDLFAEATGARKPFGFACVSKQSFDVWKYRLTAEQEAAGRRHYQDLLALWARYRSDDA